MPATSSAPMSIFHILDVRRRFLAVVRGLAVVASLGLPTTAWAQAPGQPPRASTNVPAPPPPTLQGPPPVGAAPVPAELTLCPGGICNPYYRNRPDAHCHHKENLGIMYQNRLGEPNWYKYYRCEHYGYYPTQWAPWPDGWMLCRRPFPGPHPYDIKQPESQAYQEYIRKQRETNRYPQPQAKGGAANPNPTLPRAPGTFEPTPPAPQQP